VRDLITSRKELSINTIQGAKLTGLTLSSANGWPNIKNPPYTAIWARNVKSEVGDKNNIGHAEILQGLKNQGEAFDKSSIDCLVLGDQTIVLPTSTTTYSSPFFLSGKSLAVTQVIHGSAFGVAMCVLNQAFGWMELAPIDWSRAIAHSVG